MLKKRKKKKIIYLNSKEMATVDRLGIILSVLAIVITLIWIGIALIFGKAA